MQVKWVRMRASERCAQPKTLRESPPTILVILPLDASPLRRFAAPPLRLTPLCRTPLRRTPLRRFAARRFASSPPGAARSAEFKRARQITDKIARKGSDKKALAAAAAATAAGDSAGAAAASAVATAEDWAVLFEPTDFFVRYDRYLALHIVAASEEDHLSWIGYATSRLRKLVERLSRYPLSRIHLLPIEFPEPQPPPTPDGAGSDDEPPEPTQHGCIYFIAFEVRRRRLARPSAARRVVERREGCGRDTAASFSRHVRLKTPAVACGAVAWLLELSQRQPTATIEA